MIKTASGTKLTVNAFRSGSWHLFRPISVGSLIIVFFLGVICVISVTAQDDQSDVAPPPLILVSKAELSRLDAQTDAKARTKLALELMNEHLTAAEKLNTSQDFPAVYHELGIFQGLMDNSLDYLVRRDSGSNKILDNFKRLEIGLRGFGPRLEGIYRNVPHRFEEYVRKLMKYVRDARTKATDPLFSDTVLPKSST